MNKILLLLSLCLAPVFAETINPKKCESIKLSNLTTLVSCHQRDYIIEYYEPKRDDEDSIKKITVITINDKKIIRSMGK